MHPVHRAVGGSVARLKTRVTGGFEEQHGLLVLCWHRFGTLRDGLSISSREFVAQIDLLESVRANIIPLGVAVEGLSSGSLPKRTIALTFDDGYSSVGEWAWPVLAEKHLPATLFAVPGYFGEDLYFPWDRPSPETRLMKADDVRRVASQGMDVQCHSLRHRWLPNGSDTAVLEDLLESKARLETLIDKAVDGLAYPAGGWDRRVRRIVRAAGYRYAVSVDRGVNPLASSALHNLRRCIAPETAAELEIMLAGGFDYLRTIERLRRRRGGARRIHRKWQ